MQATPDMATMTLGQRCHNEVLDLHRFFERWFSGDLADESAARDRVDRALADEFRMVSPRGVVDTKRDLVPAILRGGGRRPGLQIRIEGFEVVYEGHDLAIVVYREQQHDGETTERFSTAVLRDAPAAPHGVQWVHLHETWLEPDDDATGVRAARTPGEE